MDFYPRSPCGERLFAFAAWKRALQISIHALLAESDLDDVGGSASSAAFLSTLSLRRATSNPCRFDFRFKHFYPRSPCGERLRNITLCPIL